MMTKKRLLTILATLLFIGLVVWMISLRPKDSLAGLVPDHASWYLEVDKPIDVLKGIQKGLRLFTDPNSTLFSEWQEELLLADNLFKSEAKVYSFIKGSTLGISSHAITGKEAGYVFYISLPQAKHSFVFSMLKKVYSKNSQYRYEEREYLGKSIAEITFSKTGQTYCLASCDDALVGSFSGFLVEEVVRRSGILFKPNFASRLRRDNRYTSFASKPVRLFLNLKNAPDFLFYYLSKNLNALKLTGNLGEGMLLGFDAPSDLSWKSEGFILKEANNEKGKQAQPLDPDLHSFVPSSKVVLFQLSINDLWNGFPEKKTEIEGAQSLLKQALEDEMLMGLLEGEGLKKYNHILVSKIKNKSILDQFLQSAQTNSNTDPKPGYKEKYNSYWIHQHPNPGLAGWMGGSVLKEWVPTFYCQAGSYFIMSDEVETVRNCLETLSGKGIKPVEFSPVSHHFDFRMDPSKCIPLFMESASGPFKTEFSSWLPLLKSIKNLSISDMGEEENPSVSVVLEFRIPSSSVGTIHEVKRVFLDSTIQTPPVRLDSRFGHESLWMVQDKKHQAHLLNQNLSLIFTSPMPERWVTRPQVIENEKGKNFSILCTMPHSIRMLDAKGAFQPSLNLQLPDSQSTIEHARLVDYDQNFQYRIFLSSRYGPVFGSDLNGAFLEHWKPWNHEIPLVSAPRHVRIGEKDLIIMLDKAGTLLVTNRKGELQPGFPFALKGRSNQPLFIEAGLDLQTSFVYSLSELGLMEKISFEGKNVSSIQLTRPDKDTRFQLCTDQKQKTFSLARISGNTVTIFDQGYRPVFELVTKTNQVVVQHFQFGASNKIYSITDLGAKECHLFNETGNSLIDKPIEASQPIEISRKPGADQVFQLITAFENRMSLLEFEKE